MKKQKHHFYFAGFFCFVLFWFFFSFLHTVTSRFHTKIVLFFDVVITRSMIFRFRVPQIQQNVQYFIQQNQIYTEKEIVDLYARSRMGMYKDQVQNSCGSLPVLRNIYPSFIPFHHQLSFFVDSMLQFVILYCDCIYTSNAFSRMHFCSWRTG